MGLLVMRAGGLRAVRPGCADRFVGIRHCTAPICRNPAASRGTVKRFQLPGASPGSKRRIGAILSRTRLKRRSSNRGVII